MADIRDYMAAARVTDEALDELALLGRLLSGGKAAPTDEALATVQAGRAIAFAIRELGTRLDYVLRDIDRKG